MALLRARRNMNPHAEAILAMNLWRKEYAAQRGGIMDFWEKLSIERKADTARIVDRIINARRCPLKDLKIKDCA